MPERLLPERLMCGAYFDDSSGEGLVGDCALEYPPCRGECWRHGLRLPRAADSSGLHSRRRSFGHRSEDAVRG